MYLKNKLVFILLIGIAMLVFTGSVFAQGTTTPAETSFEFGPPIKVPQNRPEAPPEPVNPDILPKIDLINTIISKYSDFYRVEFASTNYIPFEADLRDDMLYITFQNKTNLNAALFGRNLDIVRAYGEDDDGKSLILKLSVGDLKLRRFISDNFTTGFDLFYDSRAQPKKNVIYRTQLIDGDIRTSIEGDIATARTRNLSPVKKFVPKNKIIVFPKDFVGPPAITQLFKLPDNFIGPPPTDFSVNTIYEVEKNTNSDTVVAQQESNPNGVTIKLPFSAIPDTGVAASYKNNKLVVVFGNRVNFDLDNIIDPNYIKSIQQISSNQNGILVIETFTDDEKRYKFPVEVSVNKIKNDWHIDITQSQEVANKLKPTTSLNISSENFWGENRIVINKADFQKPVELFDSETGEKLSYFPVRQSGYAVKIRREFVDVKVPATIHGLIIEEKSDFLNYNIAEGKVEITKLPNLVLSDEIVSQDLTTAGTDDSINTNKVKGIFPEQSIFPFPKALEAIAENKKVLEASKKPVAKAEKDEKDEAAVKEEERKAEQAKLSVTEEKKPNYHDKRMEFQAAYAATRPEDRNILKLNYAQWLFEHGLYYESKIVLDELIKTAQDFTDISKAKILRAGSEFMVGRYDDAYANFTKIISEINNNINYNELKLWQWASNYKQLDRENKFDDDTVKIDFTSSYDKFMQQYPDELKIDIGLMYVNSKIQKNQLNEARNVIEAITYKGVPDTRANDVTFLTARLDALTGNNEIAIKQYEELSKNVLDRKNRAFAGFEIVKQKLITNKITIEEAIKELESLSFMWRDDYFEVGLYSLVGQLYLSEGRYFDALYAWRNIVNSFPTTADSIVVLGKMKKVFADLFDGGIAYRMKPLEALNIYFSFQDLIPVGTQGDVISRKFADYLIKTDLTEDASKILEHQVKFRSEGDTRDQLILKLAEMYMKNKQNEKVTQTLKLIDDKYATDEVKNRAKYLRASLTAQEGEYEKALRMIRDDFSYDAMSVRLQLFWLRENWFGVISIVESRLNEMNDTRPESLNPKEMDQLMKLAVSYSAQEEYLKLDKLLDNFRSRISNPNDLKVLDYLALPGAAINPTDFDSSLQLSNIENFMNEYNYLPNYDWLNSISVLQPRVAKMVGMNPDDMSREDKMAVIRLATAYILIEKKDEKEQNEYKKLFSNLQRDFKDIRVDRNTLEALSMLEKRTQPIEADAVFEGKIRLNELPEFIPLLQKANKISELNISTRGLFKN